MNNRVISLLKNFSYTLTSNLVSFLISTLVILVVPKIIGIEDYGYWQLYIFYSSYIGFLQFGWNDGIYLRYGGKEYENLDKGLFFSQFWMLAFSQLVLACIIVGCSASLTNNVDKRFIFMMIALCTLIIGTRCMLVLILQGTYRIKEYARIIMTGKIVYCFLVLLLLFLGARQYKLMIIADLIGNLISLVYSAYCCKDIVFQKITSFHITLGETVQNISVGIKLMFANIASILVIGIVRFGIERAWSVSTFGKISLTLSVSNLMMIFIDAVGMVMFPILRRADKNKLSSIYMTMRTFLMAPLLGMLIIYYPLKAILSVWLPLYKESLIYMSLVFPMCVYEGKMSLLINTYLKTMRKEKFILFINVVSVFLSIFITISFTILFKNLTLAVISIVVLLAFRCILAEMFLSKMLDVEVYKDISLEIGMTAIFILAGWFMKNWWGGICYLVAYILYLVIKKSEIIMTIRNVKNLISIKTTEKLVYKVANDSE